MACLIACVTPQVVSTSFRLVTSNQRSTQSGDFVASKFYGKVLRSFFCHHKEKRKKAVLLRETSVHVGPIVAPLELVQITFCGGGKLKLGDSIIFSEYTIYEKSRLIRIVSRGQTLFRAGPYRLEMISAPAKRVWSSSQH